MNKQQNHETVTVADAMAVYNERIAKEISKSEFSEKKIDEILSTEFTKKNCAREQQEHLYQHYQHIYNNVKPATLLMNTIVEQLEDPSNKTSNVVLKHIAKTGKDDNIYIYGDDNKLRVSNIFEVIKNPEYHPNRVDDIAKDFIHTGTITKSIDSGIFAGYKLVGYGSENNTLPFGILFGRSYAYHIYLRKPFWSKWLGWTGLF